MVTTDEKAELVQGAEQPQHSAKPPNGAASSEGTENTAIPGSSSEVKPAITQHQAQPSSVQQPSPQQQHEQPPQTMALVNGQLVPVSTIPAQGSTSAQSPVPIVLPQVQVHVQGQPIAVDVQAHIFQKPTSLDNASADDNKPAEIAGLPSVQITAQQASDLKKPQAPQTQTQSNVKVNTAAANAKENDGCGLCAAIKQLFGLGKDIESGNDNQTKNDNTGSGNQSLGGAAIKVAIQSMNPTTNAASQGKRSQLPSQDPNNAAMSSNPNNSTALPSANDQYADQGVGETNLTTTTIVPVAAQPDTSGATMPSNMIYIVSDPGQIQQQDMNSVQPQPNTTGYAQTMPGYDSGQANNQTGGGVFSRNNMGEEGQGDLDEYGYDDNNYDDDDEVDVGF